jgi:hypothetical protein
MKMNFSGTTIYTPQRAFISYGNSHADSIKWFKSNFFIDAMIGYKVNSDMNRYFDFNEIFIKFYQFIFTNRVIERYVVDFSAMLFGYYPNLYLIDDGNGKIGPKNLALIWLGRAILLTTRCILSLFFLVIVLASVRGIFRLLNQKIKWKYNVWN